MFCFVLLVDLEVDDEMLRRQFLDAVRTAQNKVSNIEVVTHSLHVTSVLVMINPELIMCSTRSLPLSNKVHYHGVQTV